MTFHILRHTHGSHLAMRGVPMAMIAKQLGHADTRMTEKHYAHLAPNYVADTIRANLPTLGVARPTAEILLPTPEEREQKLRKLPTFEPHDLLELMGPTKKIRPN